MRTQRPSCQSKIIVRNGKIHTEKIANANLVVANLSKNLKKMFVVAKSLDLAGSR